MSQTIERTLEQKYPIWHKPCLNGSIVLSPQALDGKLRQAGYVIHGKERTAKSCFKDVRRLCIYDQHSYLVSCKAEVKKQQKGNRST